MFRIPVSALVAAVALTLPASASAQGAAASTAEAKAPGMRAKAAEVEIRARVVELDAASRVVTLRGPKGRLLTLNVPAEVKNFDQVKLGDDLVVRYLAAVAARLEPASKSGIRERVETTTAAKAASGDMPAVAGGRLVEVLAVVTALDVKTRIVTLRGATRTIHLEVPAGVDLGQVKVGGEVRAAYLEAAIVSVERAPAAK